MRKIEITKKFKQDYKRESKGQHRHTLEHDLKKALAELSHDKILDRKYRDHALSGEWKDCRDCHIKPDLILIYKKPEKHRVQLVRLGSHSEIGL